MDKKQTHTHTQRDIYIYIYTYTHTHVHASIYIYICYPARFLLESFQKLMQTVYVTFVYAYMRIDMTQPYVHVCMVGGRN